MGEDLWIYVRVCGSKIQQVSYFNALLAVRQDTPLDPYTSALAKLEYLFSASGQAK